MPFFHDVYMYEIIDSLVRYMFIELSVIWWLYYQYFYIYIVMTGKWMIYFSLTGYSILSLSKDERLLNAPILFWKLLNYLISLFSEDKHYYYHFGVSEWLFWKLFLHQ